MRSLKLVGIDQQALIAYIILFDRKPSSNDMDDEALKEIDRRNEILYLKFVEKVDESFSIQDLSHCLVKMAIFCSYNIDWYSTDLTSVKAVVMEYTGEEECWLQEQLQVLESAFRSVWIGDDILEEFTMFNLGVPFSKSYLPRIFAVYQERIRRIFRCQFHHHFTSSFFYMKVF